MQFSLPTIRHPRNPLARVLSLLLGIAVIAVLLVFGLAVISVLLVGGALLMVLRRWKQGSARVGASAPDGARQPDVLEGEFVVIPQPRPVTR